MAGPSLEMAFRSPEVALPANFSLARESVFRKPTDSTTPIGYVRFRERKNDEDEISIMEEMTKR